MKDQQIVLAERPGTEEDPVDAYVLGDQIGFLLRGALQRHTSIFFTKMIEGVTQVQFAALAALYKQPFTQQELARAIMLDAATMNGVVGRLKERNYIVVEISEQDRRVRILTLTDEGRSLIRAAIPCSAAATANTLNVLPPSEAQTLIRLLKKIQPETN